MVTTLVYKHLPGEELNESRYNGFVPSLFRSLTLSVTEYITYLRWIFPSLFAEFLVVILIVSACRYIYICVDVT